MYREKPTTKAIISKMTTCVGDLLYLIVFKFELQNRGGIQFGVTRGSYLFFYRFTDAISKCRRIVGTKTHTIYINLQ